LRKRDRQCDAVARAGLDVVWRALENVEIVAVEQRVVAHGSPFPFVEIVAAELRDELGDLGCVGLFGLFDRRLLEREGSVMGGRDLAAGEQWRDRAYASACSSADSANSENPLT
jgi:hypothetical protein